MRRRHWAFLYAPASRLPNWRCSLVRAAWQEEDDDWGVDLQSEAQEEEERRAREASTEFARRLEAALSTPARSGAAESAGGEEAVATPETGPSPAKSGDGYEEF